MYFLYNIAIFAASFSLKILAFFNPKIKLFVDGRKDTFSYLEQGIVKDDRIVWFHCASLGEFEQGRPLIEALKTKFPKHKIVLSFFSPSGYEVRKKYSHADLICYLPLDSRAKVKQFLDLVNPEMAIFVKYEFWPNYLRELKRRKIPTILISGIFRKGQTFFKSYGGWMRRSLNSFEHFFVQNAASKDLLNSIDIDHVTISGDTRFDRVYTILSQDNTIAGLDQFIGAAGVLVAGSTWPQDDRMLANYVNEQAAGNQKLIIAPHVIDAPNIDRLEKLFRVKTHRYSKGFDSEVATAQVLIVDTIGLLTKLYSYGAIAYVGGGFKTGLHNVLEPATFGIPILIGPQYQKFKEAQDLVQLGGCLVVTNQEELNNRIKTLFNQQNTVEEVGLISKNYVKNNLGATDQILNYLEKRL